MVTDKVSVGRQYAKPCLVCRSCICTHCDLLPASIAVHFNLCALIGSLSASHLRVAHKEDKVSVSTVLQSSKASKCCFVFCFFNPKEEARVVQMPQKHFILSATAPGDFTHASVPI